jgi:hypothetical protein
MRVGKYPIDAERGRQAAILEQLSMKWWREQWRNEEPLGIPIIFWWLGALIAATTFPLVVIAVGMSFIVPVEPWVVTIAVLAGWPSQWRLGPALIGTWPVMLGVALGWVIAAFVAVRLLGPELAAVVMIAASPIAFWAIDRLEGWKEALEYGER